VHADGWIRTAKLALFMSLGFVRFESDLSACVHAQAESRPASRRYRLLQLSSAKTKLLWCRFINRKKKSAARDFTLAADFWLFEIIIFFFGARVAMAPCDTSPPPSAFLVCDGVQKLLFCRS
jgi:hypothetical protein